MSLSSKTREHFNAAELLLQIDFTGMLPQELIMLFSRLFGITLAILRPENGTLVLFDKRLQKECIGKGLFELKLAN